MIQKNNSTPTDSWCRLHCKSANRIFLKIQFLYFELHFTIYSENPFRIFESNLNMNAPKKTLIETRYALSKEQVQRALQVECEYQQTNKSKAKNIASIDIVLLKSTHVK